MNRMLRPFIAGGLIAAALAMAAGCADNDSTLFVYGVLAEPSGTCAVTADPGELMRGEGHLDIALSTSYGAWLLVGNQYSPRGAKQQLKTETTKVTLTGAEITLTSASTGQVISCPNSANCGGPFSVYGSGFANSSRSEDPGWGAINVQFIPNAVGEFFLTDAASPVGALGPVTTTVIASIRVYGTTLGGQDVETGAFTYPIQICNGCLISKASCSNFDQTLQMCVTKAGVLVTPPCRPGQDAVFDCTAYPPATQAALCGL